jgi:hypothetical protein
VLPEAEQGMSYSLPALQDQGKDDRRIRRVQEPPELPAAQRLRLPPARGGAQGLLHLDGGTAVRHRPPPARSPGGKADRGAAPAGFPRLSRHQLGCWQAV